MGDGRLSEKATNETTARTPTFWLDVTTVSCSHSRTYTVLVSSPTYLTVRYERGERPTRRLSWYVLL